MFLLTIMLTVVFILIGVAFLTLMERKVLSYMFKFEKIQMWYISHVKPISDAIKLFFKEHIIPVMSNYIIYMMTPITGLFNSLLIWSMYLYMINCFI